MSEAATGERKSIASVSPRARLLRLVLFLGSLSTCGWLCLGPCAGAEDELKRAQDFSRIDAGAILRGVRESQAAIRQSLQGRLRSGARKLPYRMVMDGSELRFEFPEALPPDPQVVSLQFGERDASVQAKVAEGNLRKVQFEDEIAGMGVLYEDLSMRYLYWKDAEVVDEERMLPPLYVKCWKIRVRRPPKLRSPYREVLVWVSQENGGILKSEAYDDKGELVRRLKVVSIQGSDQGTTLKQMRIESPKMGSNYIYLDVDGKSAPRSVK